MKKGVKKKGVARYKVFFLRVSFPMDRWDVVVSCGRLGVFMNGGKRGEGAMIVS